jgi:hypothetical protein
MTDLKSTIGVLRSMDDSNTVSFAAIESLEQRLTEAVAEGHKGAVLAGASFDQDRRIQDANSG